MQIRIDPEQVNLTGSDLLSLSRRVRTAREEVERVRRRLGEAQMRLAATQDSIQAIAEAIGFEDASYFSRIFSKYIGMTPSEYRKSRTEA